ncbi:MAG: formylglycine-generating enzyme family protein [Planctomycetaceae bacterium]
MLAAEKLLLRTAWALAVCAGCSSRSDPPGAVSDEQRLPSETAGMLGRVLAWATPVKGCGTDEESNLPLEIVAIGSGIVMRLIPAGTLEIPVEDDEEADPSSPVATRKLRVEHPFYLGKFEVTFAEWQVVHPGFTCDNVYASGEVPSEPRHPMSCVSWWDVQYFLRATGTRLPTANEWEYACRAGTITETYGALDEIAWYDEPWMESEAGLPLVGQKKPNAFGLHDMLGNVSEWCADVTTTDEPGVRWFDATYAWAPPVGVPLRVFCGGSFVDTEWVCVAGRRMSAVPHGRCYMIGFRVARDP